MQIIIRGHNMLHLHIHISYIIGYGHPLRAGEHARSVPALMSPTDFDCSRHVLDATSRILRMRKGVIIDYMGKYW